MLLHTGNGQIFSCVQFIAICLRVFGKSEALWAVAASNFKIQNLRFGGFPLCGTHFDLTVNIDPFDRPILGVLTYILTWV